MSQYTGRCSGCALKVGVHANKEIVNRMTAMLCALGGIPFHCHDKLGWKEGDAGYPDEYRIKNAITNLVTAPKLIHDSPELGNAIADATATGIPASAFEEDREFIGRSPLCEGWKAAVGRLAKQGWFATKAKRETWRMISARTIQMLDGIKSEKDVVKRGQFIVEIGKSFKLFSEFQKAEGVRDRLEMR